MSNHRMNCWYCPRFDESQSCCHQSVIPLPVEAMGQALEIAAKHEFDRVNFNRKRFVLPNYLKQTKELSK